MVGRNRPQLFHVCWNNGLTTNVAIDTNKCLFMFDAARKNNLIYVRGSQLQFTSRGFMQQSARKHNN